MPRALLSDTSDWEFVHSEQDLRGRNLWDSHGHELGVIDDMVIDTDLERVVAVTLANGDQYPAEDLSIADDAVYVLNYDASLEGSPLARRQHEEARRRRAEAEGADTHRERAPDVPAVERRGDGDRNGPRRRSESASREDRNRTEQSDRRAYTDFTDDFRDHYDREYGDRGRDYSDWEPAYRFGYDMAHDPEFAGRDFADADEDLRRGYYRRMGYPMSDRHVWDDVRGAVHHAFDTAR